MLREELNASLKTALRDKDKVALGTIRLILAALKDRDIAARGGGNPDGISEDEILGMLQKMVKQREESTALYHEAGRMELAEGEAREIEVIRRFLPQPMGADEIENAVADVMADLGASSIKDMGSVMAKLREDYAGRMDFGQASAIVKKRLAG